MNFINKFKNYVLGSPGLTTKVSLRSYLFGLRGPGIQLYHAVTVPEGLLESTRDSRRKKIPKKLVFSKNAVETIVIFIDFHLFSMVFIDLDALSTGVRTSTYRICVMSGDTRFQISSLLSLANDWASLCEYWSVETTEGAGFSLISIGFQ